MAKDCFANIVEAFKGKEVDEKLLKNIIKRLEDVKEASGSDIEFRNKANALRKKNGLLLESQKKKLKENIIKKKQQEEFLGQFENKNKGIISMLMGSREVKKGSFNSISRKQTTLRHKYESMLANQLEKQGVLEAMDGGVMDLEIIKGLSELRSDNPNLKGLGEDAITAAKIIKNVQDEMLVDARAAGIDIGELAGFSISQSHDAVKVKAMGYDSWKEFILPKLDMDRTFGGLTDIKKVDESLKKMYDDIAFGKHNPADSRIEDVIISKDPLGPQARKLEGSRKLHFADPSSFHAYNVELGRGNVLSNVISSIGKFSKTTALVERLGTNPDAAFEAMLKRVKKDHDINEFQMKARFREVAGLNDIPANDILAKSMGSARALSSMGLLGKVIGISITDLPMSMGTVSSRTGQNMFQTTNELMQNFFASVPKEQRQMASEMFGLMASDTMGTLLNRIDANQDILPGMMAKAQQKFFKYAGLSFQTEVARTAITLTTSKITARQVLSGNLNESLKKALNAFDITDSQIPLLKKGIIDVEGQKIIDPNLLPDEVRDNFRNFVIDTAETGSPQPGALQKFAITRGTQAGTIPGEIARSAAQFKTVPLKMIDTMFQIWNLAPEGKAMQNVAKTALGLTAMAYAGDSALDIASNKKPRDPMDPETWKRSFVRGGSAGLYADLIFSESSKFGKSRLDDFAGPVFGQGLEVANIFDRALQGKKVGNKALNLVLRNTPGANLFWLRPALDHMILDNVRDYIEPGTTIKKEINRLKRGQEKLIK